jgi:hypothetical protein
MCRKVRRPAGKPHQRRASCQRQGALHQPGDLMRKLRKAFNIAKGEEEEASLSKIGQALRRLDPGFDPRSYGHASLSSLVNALKDQLEFRREEKGNKVMVRFIGQTIWVKPVPSWSSHGPSHRRPPTASTAPVSAKPWRKAAWPSSTATTSCPRAPMARCPSSRPATSSTSAASTRRRRSCCSSPMRWTRRTARSSSCARPAS